MVRQYNLFNDRYTVIIGNRGGVKVISNISHGKEMKISGRVKDSLRFVNLTREKGCTPESFSLSDIVGFCEGKTEELSPLSEQDINTILRETNPTFPVLTPEEVFSLPTTGSDSYGNTTYLDFIDGYTREYKQVKHTNKSNGFLNYHFCVTTTYDKDNYFTQSQTKTFKDNSVITINDLENVSNEDLINIRDIIVSEVSRRSEITESLSNPVNGTHIKEGKLIHGVVGYDMNSEVSKQPLKNVNKDYPYYDEQLENL